MLVGQTVEGVEGEEVGDKEDADGDEGEVRVAMSEAQLFFFLPATFRWQAMGGEHAAL